MLEIGQMLVGKLRGQPEPCSAFEVAEEGAAGFKHVLLTEPLVKLATLTQTQQPNSESHTV
jgi:hypothetical protein